MSRRANPTLIGLFVFGALVLAIIATLLLSGGHWFKERRQYILYFDGDAQGLKVGSQVVFLGVDVGTVEKIELALKEADQRFRVQVTIGIDSHDVRNPGGQRVNLQDRETIRHLVDRGLRGQLKTQSLLTGQLYVDLDFHPAKPANYVSDDAKIAEIPTIPAPVKELSAKLEDFPFDVFLANLADIGAATSKILTSEAIQTIPAKLGTTLSHLDDLAVRLDREGEPLLTEAKNEITELHQAVQSVQRAMDKVGRAADQVESWADQNSKIHESVSQAGSALAAAGETLQQLADQDSPAVQRLNQALLEISKAARTIRLLADTLEREPESIIWGKSEKGE